MSKIVVLGGGYAGLACLIELSKKAPQLELHLVDGAAEHCKITNLHFGCNANAFSRCRNR